MHTLWTKLNCLVLGAGAAARGRHDESHDEPVETQSLGEDKDEDHADEELGLLGGRAHTRISDDSDGHASRQAAEASGEARTQVAKGREKSVLGDNRRASTAADGLLDCTGEAAKRNERAAWVAGKAHKSTHERCCVRCGVCGLQ